VGHCPRTRPDLAALLGQGLKKQKIRAHSDFMWNTAVTDWALTFTLRLVKEMLVFVAIGL
jgi:hypothetical protein